MNARNNSDRIEPSVVNYNVIHVVDDISEDSPPVSEPVGLQETKDYLRLEDYDETSSNPTDEFDFDDDLITAYITEARMWVEQFTGIHVIPKTLRVYATSGAGLLSIPGPVTGTIIVKDKNGNVITDAEFIGISFKKMLSVYDGMINLTYTAGYADAPDWVKNAIKAYVAYAYEHRGDDDPPKNPVKAAAICRPHRRIKISA